MRMLGDEPSDCMSVWNVNVRQASSVNHLLLSSPLTCMAKNNVVTSLGLPRVPNTIVIL